MNSKSGGIGFYSALMILFIGLKLGGVINWSWFWVLFPITIPITILLFVGIVFLIIVLLDKVLKKR
jgi:hypothetical protein